MRENALHIFAALALVVTLALLTDPFMLLMPAPAQMAALLTAAALAAVFCGFILLERGGDERDAAHRALAGRAAYLSGVAILTLALIVQGLAHAIDPWVPLALAVMVLAKLATRSWAEGYR